MKVPEDGAVIAIKSDPKVSPVLRQLKARVYDYKIEVFRDISLKQPGLYNRMNAGAARATALVLGVEKDTVQEALENFAGTHRRFEYKGELNGAKVYDDYAHHPTEIEAVISGARELYPGKKLTVVFQSHTYSRTHELFDEFADALAKADRVLMLPIYAAREENESGVSAEKLVETIKEKGIEAEYFHTFEGVAAVIKESVSSDDVVFIMGAGDVVKVTSLIL
jgi:UDP-N-acetylmuramate--alanine ligase